MVELLTMSTPHRNAIVTCDEYRVLDGHVGARLDIKPVVVAILGCSLYMYTALEHIRATSKRLCPEGGVHYPNRHHGDVSRIDHQQIHRTTISENQYFWMQKYGTLIFVPWYYTNEHIIFIINYL